MEIRRAQSSAATKFASVSARAGWEGLQAEDRVLQRAVAIKFIDRLKAPSEKAAKRFLREARSARASTIRTIVVIHEIIETDEHATSSWSMSLAEPA